MSEQLRDAISKAIHDPERGWWTPSMDADVASATADAVLGMPELQAIHKALHDLAEEDRYAFGTVTPPDTALSDRGLPPSVVAWVIEGQP